jgi:Leucine-rich repeat (LRR) protein
VLPDEIANLTSLKVLAIQRNRIERLPLCLADMGRLQVMKIDGNPITFPPADVWSKKDTPSLANDNERDAVVTTNIKRYLRQFATRERLKIESEGESR